MTAPALAGILHLSDLPQPLDQISDWYQAGWPHWYGPGGTGDARHDLKACLAAPDTLPQCLVAVDRASTPVGTVSLRSTSPGSNLYPGAWLTALLVPEDLRRNGIGTALVAAAENEAAQLGFDRIHATTGSAMTILKNRRWEQVDQVETASGKLAIFRKDVPAR
ncbi:GNAT family N-acetyltransferase [uncultured Roseibium sp.]|uniref:GNAT family N-acetyltransferase n=1 Tax=uncultured Roseibium sp. TaxID=1936171 RepID=UPI00261DC9DF|nr:GNAT family N-acetyltransferase [uncultured Roseibium sp.]